MSFLLYPAEKVIATIEAKSSVKTKIFIRSRCCAKKLKRCVGGVILYIAKEMLYCGNSKSE